MAIELSRPKYNSKTTMMWMGVMMVLLGVGGFITVAFAEDGTAGADSREKRLE
ncbi:MAG: hypothetical protein FWD61_19640 [Phycisphaerales bacterium]|nr:hypothetical protein [Phycisphaerales bacterium]